MLCKLSRKQKSDCSLNLTGGEGLLAIVANELGCLTRDLLEQIVDEAVHDRHGPLGDACLGMHLLENSVDIDGVGL